MVANAGIFFDTHNVIIFIYTLKWPFFTVVDCKKQVKEFILCMFAILFFNLLSFHWCAARSLARFFFPSPIQHHSHTLYTFIYTLKKQINKFRTINFVYFILMANKLFNNFFYAYTYTKRHRMKRLIKPKINIKYLKKNEERRSKNAVNYNFTVIVLFQVFKLISLLKREQTSWQLHSPINLF